MSIGVIYRYSDILGRDVKVNDLLVYCSPLDGLHVLLVTLKDVGGRLWVSRVKANHYGEPTEYFGISDDFKIKDLVASRQYLPLDIFSDYIILKPCNLGLGAKKLTEPDANRHTPIFYLIEDDKVKVYWTKDEDVDTWYYDRLGCYIGRGIPIVYSYYNKESTEYELGLGMPLIYDNRGVLYSAKIKKDTDKRRVKNETVITRIFPGTNYMITGPLYDTQFFRQHGVFNLSFPGKQWVMSHIH